MVTVSGISASGCQRKVATELRLIPEREDMDYLLLHCKVDPASNM